MQVKTSELTVPALDWAVAKCEGCSEKRLNNVAMWLHIQQQGAFRFSTDWSQGGPIIEQERIKCDPRKGQWEASIWNEACTQNSFFGPTPLIAAMRCYVASKIGDVVDIPDELI